MVRVSVLSKRALAYGGGGITLLSAGLAFAGEFDAMLAWWVAIILLLPLLLWAYKTRFVALITISSLAFATQLITLPYFYLTRVEFAWGHVKPFNFTAFEALPMLLKVSVFLFVLIASFKLFYRVSFIGGSSRKIANNSRNTFHHPLQTEAIKRKTIKSRQSAGLYILMILLTVAALVPLNLWMFSQGISIVGVEPPHLPYRLSGILHYFTKYIAPLALAYLYFRSNRGWLPMFLLLAYAWVLGASSISRSSLMYVMLPVIYFAWLDRRKLMLVVAAYGALMGFVFVSAARNIVYGASAGKSTGNFDTGIFSMLFSIASDSTGNIFDPILIGKMLSEVFGRIDGFGNLVMAQYYDSYQVIGPLGIVKGMIWQGFAPIDLDLHHMQWQGNILIKGFVNGGGLLSSTVILGNAGMWWIALSAVVAAATLVILEKSTKRLVKIYHAPSLFSTAATGFLSMSYFTGAAGSVHYMYPFILLFIASWLPPIFNSKTILRSRTPNHV